MVLSHLSADQCALTVTESSTLASEVTSWSTLAALCLFTVLGPGTVQHVRGSY